MRRTNEVKGLAPTALCWTQEFGPNWKPISETNLPWTESGPPPLPPHAVDNRYAWLFAAVPLMGAIAEVAVLELSWDPNKVRAPHYFWAYYVAYSIFIILDHRQIRRSGNSPPPQVAGQLPQVIRFLTWFLFFVLGWAIVSRLLDSAADLSPGES